MRSEFRPPLAATFLLWACHAAAAPADLRTTAHEYYQWRDAADPVTTSDQGEHRYDSRLTDFRMSEVLRRREHIRDLLGSVSKIVPEGWSKDDRVDLILFQSQLAGADFFGRQLILGAVYLLSGRNLWTCVLAHGFIDTFGLTAAYLGWDD
jgi:uncharacterized protein (DUF885 family)